MFVGSRCRGLSRDSYIQDYNITLLCPHKSSQSIESVDPDFDTYALIDGIWQEAQKMYNHSPYLHKLPKVTLQPTTPSIYSLRRNQKEPGLCTAECACVLLNHHQENEKANELNARLLTHIQSFH